MVKGLTPEIFAAPVAFADLAQRAASFQKALAISPAMQSLIKESQAFADKVKKIYEKSGLAKLAKQIKNTFAEVKTWVKKLFVKYLPFALPITEIPRAQIQPSFGKVLQLANSYRSHSPPFYSVIK